MTRSPNVSVIIVNYNAGDRLTRCLQHLADQTLRDFEVIVIDNGSTDGSLVEARGVEVGAPTTFIEAGANLGFAAGNNRAARQAKGDWLALLNPDAYAEPNWLAELVAASARYRGVDAFGSTQIRAEEPTILDGAGDALFFAGIPYRGHYGAPVADLPGEGECFAPCAAAALYRRTTFEALGGFTEDFFCYGEDVELGFRLRLAGGRCVQVAAAHVAHEGSGISGRRSDFTMYHGHRNRVWTYLRCMPLSLLVLTLPFHVLGSAALYMQCLARGEGRAYGRAMRHGYGRLGALWRKRRRVQASRTVSVWAVARALTWSPWKLVRRRADIRPLAPSQSRPDADDP